MPRNYTNGFPAYVELAQVGQVLKYAYRCRLQSTTAPAQLGIVTLDPATITPAILLGLVIGCNSPKPNRATKVFTSAESGSDSSFISSNKVATARTQGWRITPARSGRKARSTELSEVWYVTINNIKYAWTSSKIPTALASLVNLDDIGVKKAAVNENNLCWGCEFPKPSRAAKVLNDNGDRFSTFMDPTVATLPNTWVMANTKKTGRYSLDDLREML